MARDELIHVKDSTARLVIYKKGTRLCAISNVRRRRRRRRRGSSTK